METNSENISTPRNGSWSNSNHPSIVTGIVFCSAFVLEAVLIVVGNLLTIVLFAINRNFRKKSLLLVVNMACADLMQGTVSLPMNTYLVGGDLKLWLYKGDTTSKIFYRVFDDVFMQASILSAALISTERFYAIRWPLKHRVLSTRVYHIAISISWAMAFVVSAILSLLTFFVSIKAFLHFWLPYTLALMCVMFGCNLSIWRKFRHGRTFAMQNNRASQNQRLVKTLLLITIIALLSWIPLIIMNTLLVFNFSINWNVYNGASFLNFSSSLVNPIVYALRIPEFKRALGSVYCCRKRLANKSVTANERRENRLTDSMKDTQLRAISASLEVFDTRL